MLQSFVERRNYSVKERSVTQKVKFVTKLDLTVSGGQTVTIPFCKVGDNDDIIIKNNEPIVINDKPIDKMPNTSYYYFFDDRPDEDLLESVMKYLYKLREIVNEWFDLIK